jgi:hypothetical protein
MYVEQVLEELVVSLNLDESVSSIAKTLMTTKFIYNQS